MPTLFGSRYFTRLNDAITIVIDRLESVGFVKRQSDTKAPA